MLVRHPDLPPRPALLRRLPEPLHHGPAAIRLGARLRTRRHPQPVRKLVPVPGEPIHVIRVHVHAVQHTLLVAQRDAERLVRDVLARRGEELDLRGGRLLRSRALARLARSSLVLSLGRRWRGGRRGRLGDRVHERGDRGVLLSHAEERGEPRGGGARGFARDFTAGPAHFVRRVCHRRPRVDSVECRGAVVLVAVAAARRVLVVDVRVHGRGRRAAVAGARGPVHRPSRADALEHLVIFHLLELRLRDDAANLVRRDGNLVGHDEHGRGDGYVGRGRALGLGCDSRGRRLHWQSDGLADVLGRRGPGGVPSLLLLLAESVIALVPLALLGVVRRELAGVHAAVPAPRALPPVLAYPSPAAVLAKVLLPAVRALGPRLLRTLLSGTILGTVGSILGTVRSVLRPFGTVGTRRHRLLLRLNLPLRLNLRLGLNLRLWLNFLCRLGRLLSSRRFLLRRLWHRRQHESSIPGFPQPQHGGVRHEPLESLRRRRSRGHRAKAQRILLRARQRIAVRRHQVHQRPLRRAAVRPLGATLRGVQHERGHLGDGVGLICGGADADALARRGASELTRRVPPRSRRHRRLRRGRRGGDDHLVLGIQHLVDDFPLASPRVQRRSPVRVEYRLQQRERGLRRGVRERRSGGGRLEHLRSEGVEHLAGAIVAAGHRDGSYLNRGARQRGVPHGFAVFELRGLRRG